MNRIMIIRVVVALIVILVFWLGTRRMKIVPTRFQAAIEYLLAVPRNIGTDLLGEKDGARFLPLLTTIFFVVISANFTGIIPPANIASTSLIGLPLILAIVSYVTFIYAGVKKHPGAFFKNALFPPGVPKPLYLIVTPIEFVSTFVLRPVTLTLRLLMNMLRPPAARAVLSRDELLHRRVERRLDCRWRRNPRIRLRLVGLRDSRRRAAGLRLHPVDRRLPPARAGRRALKLHVLTRSLAAARL